jgi:FixJ family two-component response regulator
MPAQTTGGPILVLDDDPAVRQMLSTVLFGAGFEVICCADVETLFNEVHKRAPRCILLDEALPETSGLLVLDRLRRKGCTAPVLMISGQADIATAVRALKHGASDFVEKPFRGPDLVARVKAAIADAERSNGAPDWPTVAFHFTGKARLTARERAVLADIVNGSSAKETARQLGLSPRTVEAERVKIMRKLGVKSRVDLVRLALSQPNLPESE